MIRNAALCALIHTMLAALACTSTHAQQAPAQPPTTRVLDAMDDAASWKVVTPEGVRLSVHEDEGVSGKCLRLDYEFVTGGGYCIIQKALPTTLPPNYEFAFHVRGQGPDNNLEFKLLDKTGDRVWWVNRRAYEWPTAWTRLSNKKRKIEFAWGPSGGAPLTEISKIEFAIASSSGGKGSVWLDELVLRELGESTPGPLAIKASASSQADDDSSASRAVDGRMDTSWTSGKEDVSTLTLDLGGVQEFGGIAIAWSGAESAPGRDVGPADACSLLWSDDGVAWNSSGVPRVVSSSRSILVVPDAQARFLRMECTHPELSGRDPAECLIGIAEVQVLPPSFAASPHAVAESLARQASRGSYPKYLLNEATYWTVIGDRDSAEEAMMNEEGQVEVGKRLFSIEPFVRLDGKVLTWADGSHTQSLPNGAIPLPTVTRELDGMSLIVTAWTEQNYGVPWLMLRYLLTNTAATPHSGDLVLATRPFQVNPTYQKLNFEGGFTPIRSVERMIQPDGEWKDRTVGLRVHTSRGTRDVFALSGATSATLIPSDDADIMQSLLEKNNRGGSGAQELSDAAGMLSARFNMAFNLAPGESHESVLAVPMRDTAGVPLLPVTPHLSPELTQLGLDHTAQVWSQAVNTPRVTVPGADAWIADTFTSQLAYILINRDGPALQPGSRSYERSWARDGSLTSAALIACGHAEEAKQWIDWFGSHQFENGKIPCVVDSRGPDPVAEHDSHGEYIWAVANYHRHTHDAEFLKRHYPRVQKAVEYIESIRAERRTPEYLDESSPKRAMYGLVPESISHEGYSAKPMHSYWDDFFVLLGLKEAAYVAEQMGDDTYAQAYAKLAAEFRMCFYDSMKRVFKQSNINYIPGCVELADFDSTSTTIALFPCDEQEFLPQQQFRNTFDRYWKFAKGRMNGEPWEAFTPYEIRHVGAFVRLGEPERAYELLTWFRQFQRPQGWNHWAEVVWKDPKTPKFIGDMPHTWVGSDYLNSVLSMFEYEHAQSLVLFAGVPRTWIDGGEPFGIERVHTSYGTLSLTMRRDAKVIRAHAEGDARTPEGGFVFRKPPGAKGGDQTVRSLPADVEWEVAP